MWQWFLAGALILINIATVLIVVVVVRLHLRRSCSPGRDEVHEEPDELTGRFSQLPDEMDPRVEERTARLEKLLPEADERIARLRRLSATAGTNIDLLPRSDPRREEVRRLAGQGIDPVGIARRLEMRVGEVELILHLDRSARVEGA